MTQLDDTNPPDAPAADAQTADATEAADAAVQRFRDRATGFTTAVHGAGGRWDAATPCPDWTVRDVVGHVIQTERDYLVQRGLAAEGEPAPGPDVTADPAAAWEAHFALVLAVMARPGVAGTRYDGYFGPTTVAANLADFYGWDLLVHGWDVARATDQPYQLAEAEIRWAERAADGWGDALRMEGICGPAVAVAADAPAQDRLLARLGRDPHWSV